MRAAVATGVRLTRYIDEEEANSWRSIADKIKAAQTLLDESVLIFMTKIMPSLSPETGARIFIMLDDATLPSAYLFTPQSEWMGGDEETSTWKVRSPHIVGA